MNAPRDIPAQALDTASWTRASAVPADKVFQQVGQLTRQLHDALEQLGVMPQLQTAAVGLPDARSRLSYIAEKCGEAANKVLTSVDLAKAEQATMAGAARELGAAMSGAADPARLAAFMATIEGAYTRTDGLLSDIMLAQDYHDLTGQVVQKVVALALALEDSLVKLLVQSAPAERVQAAGPALEGPVHSTTGRSDVVINQSEVDDLLATMGF